MFSCARCARQVRLCSRCDRGNRYCGQTCAETARAESRRRANARYQRTDEGRARHAANQQRYLERRESMMTDHGSEPALDRAPPAQPEAALARAPECPHAILDPPPALAPAPPAPPAPPASPASPAPHLSAPSSGPKACCSQCGRPLGAFIRRHFLHLVRGPPAS